MPTALPSLSLSSAIAREDDRVGIEQASVKVKPIAAHNNFINMLCPFCLNDNNSKTN
jgi:hypothetical protein